jgi:hypothetical protein
MQRSALDAEVRRSVNEKLEKSGEKERCFLINSQKRAASPYLTTKSDLHLQSPHQTERALASQTCREWLARPAEGALQGAPRAPPRSIPLPAPALSRNCIYRIQLFLVSALTFRSRHADCSPREGIGCHQRGRAGQRNHSQGSRHSA